MASAAGGMEIEEVATKSPELILKEPLEPGYGLAAFQGRNLAFGMGIPPASVNAAVAAMSALARAYQANDASLAEIKTAYRNRVKECHPDRFSTLDEQSRQLAEEWTKAINAAYASLLAQRNAR